MQKTEERGVGTGILVGGIGAGALATGIALLVAARPAQAAPTDEKLDYLVDVLITLTPVLAEVSERQATLIQLLEQWLALQGIVAGQGGEVAVSTPWIAKEPEQIFHQAIRSAGTFYADRMVNYTKGKRILFKAESSLNQAANLQVIGNIADDHARATDIDGVLPLPGNGNLTVGLAWDDWTPFTGIRITVAVAPTAGILTIWAVVQE